MPQQNSGITHGSFTEYTEIEIWVSLGSASSKKIVHWFGQVDWNPVSHEAWSHLVSFHDINFKWFLNKIPCSGFTWFCVCVSFILLFSPISENLEDCYKDLIRNRLYIFVQINLIGATVIATLSVLLSWLPWLRWQ